MAIAVGVVMAEPSRAVHWLGVGVGGSVVPREQYSSSAATLPTGADSGRAADVASPPALLLSSSLADPCVLSLCRSGGNKTTVCHSRLNKVDHVVEHALPHWSHGTHTVDGLFHWIVGKHYFEKITVNQVLKSFCRAHWPWNKYVYMYMYASLSLYICAYRYVCMHIYAYVYMDMYVYICVCMYIWIFMDIYAYVFMHIYLWI